MAATTAGAVKALLESLGLGVSVFRDRAPENQALPYVTVAEGISVVTEDAFNAFDDPEGHVREEVQVDVWQQWRDPATRAVTESYTLPDAVARGMNGVRLAAAPFPVAGVRVIDGPARLVDPDPNIVHHVISVEVRRTLQRIA